MIRWICESSQSNYIYFKHSGLFKWFLWPHGVELGLTNVLWSFDATFNGKWKSYFDYIISKTWRKISAWPSDWQNNHFASTRQKKVLSLHWIGLADEELQKLATLGLGYLLQFSIFLCFLKSAEMEMKRKSPTCDCGSGSAPAWRRRSTISLKPETCDKFPQTLCPKHYICIQILVTAKSLKISAF